jgi:hypothetical protein
MGLRFPRLNNISFWCALLWIFIGYSSVLSYESVTQDSGLKLNGILAVAKPCKLSDLPKFEKTRGPEHVTKAIDRERTKLYDLLPSTFLHDSTHYACGAFDNPIVKNNNDIIMSLSSDQSVDEATIITLQSQTIKQSTGSTKYNAHKESTTGFPKGSNSYGDGVPILVTWKREHPNNKVGQRTFSTTSLAAVPQKGYIRGSDLESKLKMRNGKYYDLLKLVSNPDVLIWAYHSIKSKAGNWTPETDNKTLDGISPEFFTKLSKDIRSEKFQFKPTRKFDITKTNGKIRPLGSPKPYPNPYPNPKPYPKPYPYPEPYPNPYPEPNPKTKAKTYPKTNPKAKPEPKTKTKAKPYPKTKPKAEPNPKTSPSSKIVQKAMEFILNLIFEPRFLEKNQGSFRSNYRSRHSAMKQVAK